MEEQDTRNRIVRKMLRNQVVGGHKKQVDTIVTNYLPTHERGRGKQMINEMVSDRGAPIEAYGGGHRDNVRLTSVEAAVDYLNRNDGDVPFGFN